MADDLTHTHIKTNKCGPHGYLLCVYFLFLLFCRLQAFDSFKPHSTTASKASLKKSSETEKQHLSMRRSPRKAGFTINEDKNDETFSSAEDEARSHSRCPLKHHVGYSDSDLTDNSSGEQGHLELRSSALMALIVMTTMMMVCVCFQMWWRSHRSTGSMAPRKQQVRRVKPQQSLWLINSDLTEVGRMELSVD